MAAAEDLLTPTRVRELLDRHGLAPRKRLGQNFVVDANTVRKAVRDAGVAPGDLVVEVGPGVGSLTLALRAAGAQVLAIEIDAGLVGVLREVVDEGVQVLHADALRVDWAALVDRPARLVANLPYASATPVVLTALEHAPLRSAHVMVQREVGERWCARVGNPAYGAVSVKIAALADARIVAAVPRTAFWPVPNVNSVTVGLEPHAFDAPADYPALREVVDAGFAQRRKRLRNALASGERSPGDVEAALAAAGLPTDARAEQLDLAQWRRLAAALEAPAQPAPQPPGARPERS